MHITFVTESQQSNSLGRTYCLWLLARHLGWHTTTLTTTGIEVWPPLRGTEFAEQITRADKEDLEKLVPASTDLIIASKPLPNSLGLARRLGQSLKKPILLDIDDPDLEIRTRAGNPVLGAARWVRRPSRSWQDLRNKRTARSISTIVSNPWLKARYGGTVIPHVRPDLGPGTVHVSKAPKIAFVGSVHQHKGLDLLRSATSMLQGEGVTLTVTAEPPADAHPNEAWVGQTTLEAGLKLASDADIIALPSMRSRNSTGQLPAKLVDAMLLGRAIIVSDVPPMPWAVGDSGLIVPAGDVSSLTDAIRTLSDPHVRAKLGDSARKRALENFTVEVVAPSFAHACKAAMAE